MTGKSFEKGPDCFKDLLDLQLHNYADDVSDFHRLDDTIQTFGRDWPVDHPSWPELGGDA